jgi:hypothetical protein
MGALDDAIREHLELKRRHGASDEEIRQAEAEALGPARRGPAGGVAAPSEAYVDEVGMPAPPEGVDAPPMPSDAVEDAPPPPPPPGVEPPQFPGDPIVGEVAEPPAPDLAEPPASDLTEPAHDVVEPAHDVVEPVEPIPAAEPAMDETAIRQVVEPAPVEPPAVEPPPVETPPVEPPPVEPPPVEPAAEPVEAPDPGTPKPHGDPALDAGADLPDDPDRTRTAILDDPLEELAPPPAPVHHEPGPDEPPAPARPAGAEPIAADHAPPPPGEEDVLEETPDFLQETPEHDRLWFEQKPPRDFDFDD